MCSFYSCGHFGLDAQVDPTICSFGRYQTHVSRNNSREIGGRRYDACICIFAFRRVQFIFAVVGI